MSEKELSHEEFLKLAEEKFGDKVRCSQITNISDETAQHLGVTKEDILNYPAQAWLVNDDKHGNPQCPNCGEGLFGIRGAFEWGIAHGYGYCSGCKQVGFQLYHYIGEPEKRLEMLAVSSF